ncbi:MAG: peptidase M28, partial [Proteobacteria bacterium]|nr:peptidase M28 [Pseudomonadota bacterium]
ANLSAVAWAAQKFRQAEVAVMTEDFAMPAIWEENFVTATIAGDSSFGVGAVAKPFSAAANALEAPLLDAGFGTAEEFERLGDAASGAWLLVETPVLDDVVGLSGLFKEYADAVAIETRAALANVAGVVFMSSRPKNLLFRHNAGAGSTNELVLLVLER